MKKKEGNVIAIIAFTAIIIVVVLIGCILFLGKIRKNETKPENKVAINETQNVVNEPTEEPTSLDSSGDIEILPTMNEKIKGDAVWCPTFQLVWNDMKNEVVGQDVEFLDDDEPEYLENLNAELFTEDDISEEYYYKKWGKKSNELKQEIIDGIKEKFDEKSDVIKESDNWDNSKDGYVFYCMLKRAFKFKNPFDVLEDGYFNCGDGKTTMEAKFFGVTEDSDKKIREQINVYYYNGIDDFAFSVDTKDGDEVIFAKGLEADTFAERYEEIQEKSKKYTGDKTVKTDDKVVIPNLKFDLLKEYEELENKSFTTKDKESYFIEKALQTIRYEMDNEGGEIKSEAIIMLEKSAIDMDEKDMELRKNFTMFIKEEKAELPYFAVNVVDITKFQEGIESLMEEE